MFSPRVLLSLIVKARPPRICDWNLWKRGRYLPKCPALDDKHGETAKVPVTKGGRVKEAFDQEFKRKPVEELSSSRYYENSREGGKKSEERRLERDRTAIRDWINVSYFAKVVMSL